MRQFFLWIVICTMLFCGVSSAKQIQVVTSFSDLASITRYIGGDKVSVTSIMNGLQDPHFTEPRPSMLVRVRNADLVIINGMDLDVWMFTLIAASRNSNIVVGKNGFLDVSGPIDKLDVPPPGARLSENMGDVHPQGNPHYLPDPVNGKIVAGEIAEQLSLLSPENQKFFYANLKSFDEKIDQIVHAGKEKLARLGNLRVLEYHENLEYFARRFGLNIIGALESKPGIPPSPSHLAKVIQLVREKNVRGILIQVYYDRKSADFVALQTGIKVVVIPDSVGGTPDAKDYFTLFDDIFNRITKAFGGQ